MTQQIVTGLGQLEDITIEARVFRCTCGQPDAHKGQPCPVGVWEQPQVVAHWKDGETPKQPVKLAGRARISNWMKGIRK
jgi:hypothetical protein